MEIFANKRIAIAIALVAIILSSLYGFSKRPTENSVGDSQLDNIPSSGQHETPIVSDTPVLDETYELGKRYYEAGEYSRAITELRKIQESSSYYADAQMLLIEVSNGYRAEILQTAGGYAAREEYTTAINILENALLTLPNDSELQRVSDEYKSAYKSVVRTEAIEQADAYVTGDDYENAIKTLNAALAKIGQDNELSAKKTVYYNEYKEMAFQAIDEAYDGGGYESAISLLNSYQSFFSNDSEFNEKYDYYKTLKPISPFSLSPYKFSGTWGVTYYPSYKDALGKTHDDVYINSGTSYGLAPGAAWAQYYIESEYKTLTGEIAFDSSSGSGYIQILSGDTIIYTSPSVSGTDGSIEFSVDISGVDLLGIQIRSGRDTGWGGDSWNCNSVMLIGLMLRK